MRLVNGSLYGDSLAAAADTARAVGLGPALTGSGELSLLAATIKVVAALVVTLVLLLAAVWVLRRISGGAISGGGGAIVVREIRHLGPKKAVVLVEVAGRVFLLGIAEQSLVTLGELTSEEAARLPRKGGESEGGQSFAAILRSFRRGS